MNTFWEKVEKNKPLYSIVFWKMFKLYGHVRSKVNERSMKNINPARHRFDLRTMFPKNMKKLQWILSKKGCEQSTNPSHGQTDGWTGGRNGDNNNPPGQGVKTDALHHSSRILGWADLCILVYPSNDLSGQLDRFSGWVITYTVISIVHKVWESFNPSSKLFM